MVVVVVLLFTGLMLGAALVRKLLFVTTAMIVTAQIPNWSGTASVDQAASQFDTFRNAWSGNHTPWDGINRLKAIDTNGGL